MTALGLGPARAAVRCLLPGIKIANVLLVSHRAPACVRQAGHYSDGRGGGGLSGGQAPAKGTVAALLSSRARWGEQLDGHLQSSAVRLVALSVLFYICIWRGRGLTEFPENSLYFCCVFSPTLSKSCNLVCVKRF